MTRSELIKNIQRKVPNITFEQAEQSVDLFFQKISEQLADKGRVEIRGFGVFTVRRRQPREGRNPKTGELVSVQGKDIPFFKAGKGLNDRLNDRKS